MAFQVAFPTDRMKLVAMFEKSWETIMAKSDNDTYFRKGLLLWKT